MLRSLLEDRFKMTTHGEKRQLAVFALERATRDGALGPGLRPTACPELAVDLSGPKRCANIQTGFGSLNLRGMPLSQFTPYLSPFVNRIVVDRSALEGRYDIDLKWTPEQRGPDVNPAGASPTNDPDAVSIFTAIQEQLGLRLNSTQRHRGRPGHRYIGTPDAELIRAVDARGPTGKWSRGGHDVGRSRSSFELGKVGSIGAIAVIALGAFVVLYSMAMKRRGVLR